MVLLQAREPIRRFEFTRVEAGSVVADLLSLTPVILKVRGVWVCNGHPCPNCGAETMYVQNLNPAIELEDRPALHANMILRARAEDYSCTCGIQWTNVAGRKALQEEAARQFALTQPQPIQVGPSPPVIH